MIDFNNKDEVALIHKHLSTEIYIKCGISLGWIETIRKYIEHLEIQNMELLNENERLKTELAKAEQCILAVEDALDRGTDNDYAREAIEQYEITNEGEWI